MSDLSDEESRNQKIKCQTCGIEFDQMEVEDHITNCHRCEFCDKLLKNKMKHIKNVHNHGDTLHQCDICRKIFKLPIYLEVHLKNVHGNKPQKSCDSCGKPFFNRTDLRRHIEMVHEGRKDYKCETCEKLFSTADNLKKHFRSVIHVENHFQWLDY